MLTAERNHAEVRLPDNFVRSSPDCVVIPSFNNPKGLERTLTNLQAASGEFDVIVVDDGSSPSVSIATHLSAPHPVAVLRLTANQGISEALNTGFIFALGKGYRYLGRIDTGDLSAPDRWIKQFAYLGAHPRVAIVGTHVAFVDQHRRPLFNHRPPGAPEQLRKRMHLENCLIHSSVSIRADCIRSVGLYANRLAAAEDYGYFLRAGLRFDLACIEELLTECEMVAGGISLRHRRRQQLCRLQLQALHFDYLCPHSYLGLFRTVVSLLLPFRLVAWLKARRQNGHVPSTKQKS